MQRFLLAPLVGVTAAFLYSLNLAFWCLLLASVGLLRFIPGRRWQIFCRRGMDKLLAYWTRGNTWVQRLTLPGTRWEVVMPADLKREAWYLLICNHQSWADILVLQRVFDGRIPPLKFFLKRQLLWQLPLASWACWLLNFPFMQRHTRAQLRLRPSLKTRNIEVTRRACEGYRHIPTTIANFVEGSRFTPVRHARQHSPYRHLLRPQAGGIAFSLSVLGPYFDTVLDVTLMYPQGAISLWDFLCGRVRRIVVQAQRVPVTEALLGDYEHDRLFRIRFQRWLNHFWCEKDEQLTRA